MKINKVTTKDGFEVLMTYSSRVPGGERVKGALYLYYSFDNGKTWRLCGHRSQTLLAEELGKYTCDNLKTLGY